MQLIYVRFKKYYAVRQSVINMFEGNRQPAEVKVHLFFKTCPPIRYHFSSPLYSGRLICSMDE